MNDSITCVKSFTNLSIQEVCISCMNKETLKVVTKSFPRKIIMKIIRKVRKNNFRIYSS